ncbi:hypothetical protein SteCoe_26086 [Stentor coeruleus]|uniref:Uncharacterized protein n=1 Tax=Stentor coeruleus TaxID=5963 RepID=A0A1R2BDP3_9CILI|nr:hypothetical protein SteCoe_26086 [Stentor coeruleus]
MEKLTDLKFLVSKSDPWDPNRNYSKKSPNPLLPVFYINNSLEKSQLLQKKFDKKQAEKSAKESNLTKQTQKKLKAQKARELQENLNKIVFSSSQHHYSEIQKLHNSATKIQKNFRCYLQRKSYETKIILIEELKLSHLLNEMSLKSQLCFYYLGTNTIPAVLKIQRFYRKYVFHQKVTKLMSFYEVITAARREKADSNAKKILLNVTAKLKTIFQKSITHEYRVLRKVREKLAIITVSKYWKKKKLTYKSLKDKILKIKRRIFAIKSKEAYQKQISAVKVEENNLKDEEKINEDDLDKIIDENTIKSKKEKENLKKLYNQKLQALKISYAVENMNLIQFNPHFQSENSSENEDIESRIQYTESILRKTCKRAGSLDTRNTQIGSPVKLHHKRYFSPNFDLPMTFVPEETYKTRPSPLKLPLPVGQARYLNNTNSFAAKNSPYLCTPSPLPKVLRPQQKYLNKETISYSLKKRQAIKNKYPKEWDISIKNHDVYVPSIHNIGYIEEPLKIAQNNLSTKDTQNNSIKSSVLSLVRNKHDWSSSLFSVSPSTMEASTVDLLR